jgi:hypothetical protein
VQLIGLLVHDSQSKSTKVKVKFKIVMTLKQNRIY